MATSDQWLGTSAPATREPVRRAAAESDFRTAPNPRISLAAPGIAEKATSRERSHLDRRVPDPDGVAEELRAPLAAGEQRPAFVSPRASAAVRPQPCSARK